MAAYKNVIVKYCDFNNHISGGDTAMIQFKYFENGVTYVCRCRPVTRAGTFNRNGQDNVHLITCRIEMRSSTRAL
ncbi:unnamed protein product [Macrosiphum euphorbiae]|uniref:Uncharacterized protein n=1 Tax=Macrosiphum euphorbiae TaxID=13131 RepID=A0AAV0XDT5_9HEMI|nr:unnamed protein product [Macrosiphum euphorbiae]